MTDLSRHETTDDANFFKDIVVNDICIIWMTRYCLERGSDSISLRECTNALLNNWSELDRATRNLLAAEITNKIKNRYFMLDEDKVLWNSVLENHNENKNKYTTL